MYPHIYSRPLFVIFLYKKQGFSADLDPENCVEKCRILLYNTSCITFSKIERESIPMKEKLNAIPLWFINAVTVVSGIIAILSPIAAAVGATFGLLSVNTLTLAIIVAMALFILILFLLMRKYRKLAHARMSVTSENYHKFLHEVRDVYFDIMHSHKSHTLTEAELSHTYQRTLSAMLDRLCNIFESFTGRKVSACIKLISYGDGDETSIDNAKLITFCRSTNSDTGRGTYEGTKEILLRENTDFFEIVSPEYSKNYFYHGDLEKYSKELLKTFGKPYQNTDVGWSQFYKGTAVVPIQIEFKRLYYVKKKKDTKWHIMGFLCVDSLSKDAFEEKQETYNIDILRSFADAIYILLGQYRHYLKKLTNPGTPKDI